VISGGLLRWTATVTRPASGVDALGMRKGTFANVGTMRCDMRDQSANEQEYADGVSVLKQYEVRVRWPNIARLSVTPVDRLTVRGKTLRINHIRNLDEDDRVAVIECTEVT
jgi:head-tail adaptor